MRLLIGIVIVMVVMAQLAMAQTQEEFNSAARSLMSVTERMRWEGGNTPFARALAASFSAGMPDGIETISVVEFEESGNYMVLTYSSEIVENLDCAMKTQMLDDLIAAGREINVNIYVLADDFGTFHMMRNSHGTGFGLCME